MIEDGVIRGVVWDRVTAARARDGQVSTGHAPPDAWRFFGPLPTAYSMAAGEASSSEELAELVGDGIYVTRLHYLGIVDPRGGVLTGMTRDGTFRIRDGKIAEPLVNLRFTVAMSDVLGDVPGPDPGPDARQPERPLRRALRARRARAGDRDRPLPHQRDRLRAGTCSYASRW